MPLFGVLPANGTGRGVRLAVATVRSHFASVHSVFAIVHLHFAIVRLLIASVRLGFATVRTHIATMRTLVATVRTASASVRLPVATARRLPATVRSLYASMKSLDARKKILTATAKTLLAGWEKRLAETWRLAAVWRISARKGDSHPPPNRRGVPENHAQDVRGVERPPSTPLPVSVLRHEGVTNALLWHPQHRPERSGSGEDGHRGHEFHNGLTSQTRCLHWMPFSNRGSS